MEYRKTDIDIKAVKKFKVLTTREIANWTKETEGTYTNNIGSRLGIDLKPNHKIVTYTGNLTLM